MTLCVWKMANILQRHSTSASLEEGTEDQNHYHVNIGISLSVETILFSS